MKARKVKVVQDFLITKKRIKCVCKHEKFIHSGPNGSCVGCNCSNFRERY